jgi:hypothetical protein
MIGTKKVRKDKTTQLFDAVISDPARTKLRFSKMPAIVNVDCQNARTRINNYKTAHEIEHVETISAPARAMGMPVIWAYVAYMDDAADAGVWGIIKRRPADMIAAGAAPQLGIREILT